MARFLEHRVLPDRAELVRLIPAIGVLAVWVALMPAAGGFDPSDWLPAGIALAALLGLAAVGGGRLLPAARPARAALLVLATFTAWSFASIAWSAAPGDAWESANQLLVTLLGGWTLALAPWRRRTAELGMLAFAAAAAVVCAVTLLDALSATDLATRFTDGRFNQPLDYPNTSAAFCVIAALPVLVVAARPGAGIATKTIAQGLCGFLAAFALLPQSRGSIVGAIVAVIVLLALVPFRWRLALRLLVTAAAVAVAAAPVLEVYDTASAGGRVGPALDGAAWALLAAMIVALAGGLALTLAERRFQLGERGRRVARVAGLALIAVVIVASAGAAVVNHERLANAVDDQWQAVRHPGSRFAGRAANAAGSNRLTGADPLERPDYWRVSVNAFLDHPLAGIGTGGFNHLYTTERRYPKASKYPHNLLLRVLAETGAVGSALWLAFLGLLAVGLLRGLRRGDAAERGVVAAAAGAVAYFAVHSSFDWLEAHAVLTGPVLGVALMALCVRDRAARLAAVTAPAAATQEASRRPRKPRRLSRVPAIAPGPMTPVGRLLGSAVLVLAVVSLLLPWLSRRYEERAVATWRTQPTVAFADLRRAADLNPLGTQAPIAEGLIAIQLGDAGRARRAFATALERERAWLPHLELALLDAERGDRRGASAQLDQAHALSPLEPVLGAARELLAKPGRPAAAAATRQLFEQVSTPLDRLS